MTESDDAVVMVGSIDSSTVFVHMPSALADQESASVSEDELRYVLQRGIEAAPPDSRMAVSVDGPALVGVIELQGDIKPDHLAHQPKLNRPTEEERHAVVEILKRELKLLGYDVNPESRQAMTGKEWEDHFNSFVKRVSQ